MKFEDSAQVTTHVKAIVLKVTQDEFLTFEIKAKSRGSEGDGRGTWTLALSGQVLRHREMPSHPPQGTASDRWPRSGEPGLSDLIGHTRRFRVGVGCVIPGVEFTITVKRHQASGDTVVLKYTCWSDEVSDIENLFGRDLKIELK